jgi:hypothetical protein
MMMFFRRIHHNNKHHHRWFSNRSSSNSNSNSNAIQSALKLLNLSHQRKYNPKELRDAYFTAAKCCHPDSPNAKVNVDVNVDIDVDMNTSIDEEERKAQLTNQFHAISEAYELLIKEDPVSDDFSSASGSSASSSSESLHDYITKSEEQHFREACDDFLGVDAEIVEESKQCPLFRQWLKGRTVDAFLWNMFLMKHGGLAPMLRRKKTLHIEQGDVKKRTRRRRDDF